MNYNSYSNNNKQTIQKWQEQSKPQERTLEAKPQESTLLTNKQRKHQLLLLPVESRNHTDSDQVQLLSEKSEDSKRAPSSSLESFPSKDSLERLPLSSRMTSDSNPQQSLLSKKPQKLTSLVSSKTLTSVPSTPRE